MSAGNANTDGNKKNNYSWQKNVLLMLKEVKDAVVSSGGGSGPGVSRTTTSTVETISGSVAAGARWVNFITSEDFSGSINGATQIPSFSFMMPPNGNDVYGAIPYVITTGNIRIDKNV